MTNVAGMRGGAHAEKTLLKMQRNGIISEEERLAMGGSKDFPDKDPSTLPFSYGSQKALKEVLRSKNE